MVAGAVGAEAAVAATGGTAGAGHAPGTAAALSALRVRLPPLPDRTPSPCECAWINTTVTQHGRSDRFARLCPGTAPTPTPLFARIDPRLQPFTPVRQLA
ncbi:hypothetical protein GCM10022233_08050 [Streptomyces shaanxiensis]|uniref:Secreted protein n=1 Tax=Streptomyces shaanxiensis TaxID=653357 RepID=A0ABP7UEI5_9ACTN